MKEKRKMRAVWESTIGGWKAERPPMLSVVGKGSTIGLADQTVCLIEYGYSVKTLSPFHLSWSSDSAGYRL